MNVSSPPRSARRIGAVLVVGLALAACGGSADEPPSSEAPASTASTAADTTSGSTATTAPASDGPSDGTTTPSPDCLAPEGDLGVFGAAVVVVVAADGTRVERCVLVADRTGLRNQGLMRVTDLGAYDGMVFAYAGTSTGGYWMMDTPMPLTIAWIGADGRVVATADMEPCVDRPTCPSYEPGATYRWALEVPQGGLDAFGLTDGAAVDVSSLPVGFD